MMNKMQILKGTNAGWICEINGIVCKDLANTLVNNGDKVEFYIILIWKE